MAARPEEYGTVSTRAVRAGEFIPVMVEGGVVRRPAPRDGVLVENADVVYFVPVTELEERLAELGRTVVDVSAALVTREVGPARVGVAKGRRPR